MSVNETNSQTFSGFLSEGPQETSTANKREFTPYTGKVRVEWDNNVVFFLASKVVNFVASVGTLLFVDSVRLAAYALKLNDGTTSYWKEKVVQGNTSAKLGNWQKLSSMIIAQNSVIRTEVIKAARDMLNMKKGDLGKNIDVLDKWNCSVEKLTTQTVKLTALHTTDRSIALITVICGKISAEYREDTYLQDAVDLTPEQKPIKVNKALLMGATVGVNSVHGVAQKFNESDELKSNLTTALRREFHQDLKKASVDALEGPFENLQKKIDSLGELGIQLSTSSILSKRDVPLIKAGVEKMLEASPSCESLVLLLKDMVKSAESLGLPTGSLDVEEINTALEFMKANASKIELKELLELNKLVEDIKEKRELLNVTIGEMGPIKHQMMLTRYEIFAGDLTVFRFKTSDVEIGTYRPDDDAGLKAQPENFLNQLKYTLALLKIQCPDKVFVAKLESAKAEDKPKILAKLEGDFKVHQEIAGAAETDLSRAEASLKGKNIENLQGRIALLEAAIGPEEDSVNGAVAQSESWLRTSAKVAAVTFMVTHFLMKNGSAMAYSAFELGKQTLTTWVF
jgi:hypothetical protein